MRCAWQAYLNLLPIWLRTQVDRLGKDSLRELRLRLGMPPELVRGEGSIFLDRPVTEDDLNFCINLASRYSPWSAVTISQGFITAPGGHRIGICGEAVVAGQRMSGIRHPGMLCIRVARDFPNITAAIKNITGSTLIIGKPGSGKTTLLRDLVRLKSDFCKGSICVIDERQEIFPRTNNVFCFETGKCTDVMSGCSKRDGIISVIRSMNPTWIAIDEITAEEDCKALIYAGWCGVELIATAHAGSKQDLYTRPVYSSIIECGVFQNLIVLKPDQTWSVERMCKRC